MNGDHNIHLQWNTVLFLLRISSWTKSNSYGQTRTALLSRSSILPLIANNSRSDIIKVLHWNRIEMTERRAKNNDRNSRKLYSCKVSGELCFCVNYTRYGFCLVNLLFLPFQSDSQIVLPRRYFIITMIEQLTILAVHTLQVFNSVVVAERMSHIVVNIEGNSGISSQLAKRELHRVKVSRVSHTRRYTETSLTQSSKISANMK